jgi:dTDP-4-amino-4,6-dideoxygalactose transaminase
MQPLAVFGGEPVFATPLHVGRPNIGDRERFHAYVDEIFDNRWLTNRGPLVRQFEHELSLITGARHCITVCNATIGLEMAIRALGLRGEVIVPSFTFIATAHALQWLGLTPVFCDIDPRTHNLDPAAVEKLITPQTSGIIGVHLWGRPCAVKTLQEVADVHHVKLLFDAAHAFGCSHEGVMIGNFGDVEVFSFHATKAFNTFEGGVITTQDDELARRLRLMENFGFIDYDRVEDVGTNGKMSEICAAMGLTNLQAQETFLSANLKNYHSYQKRIADIPGLSLQSFDEKEKCNFQYVVLEVDPRLTGLSRDMLWRVLQSENVLARRYFWPGCHRMEPYRTLFPDAGRHLPNTEQIAERVMVLPNGATIGETEVDAIAEILATAVEHAEPIRRKLSIQPSC